MKDLKISLKTKRTKVRNIEKSDLMDFYDYSHQAGLGEKAGWRHHENLEEAKRALDLMVNGGRVLAVEYLEDNKMVGHISINNDSENNRDDTKELGFVLNGNYHNKGIMSEAVSATIDYLFTTDINYIYACCFQDNIASRKLIEKCGFSFEKEGTYYSYILQESLPSYEYVYTKDQWLLKKNT